ncbi:hypothetical protein F5B20DRAFT_358996 [Whalleya microplaca]|nr:hypothetical protein F5B20DRAFT_358996 [Whalleya microplaca]
MQKILRRVATAERVAAKRRKEKNMQFFKKEKKETTEEQRQHWRRAKIEFDQAKSLVRDDWELGPLAPRTDYGDWADAQGAIHETRFGASAAHSLAQRNRRCRWLGGAYNLNLFPGDRVVLLDGPDKGRIGQVQDINHMRAEVTVSQLNKSNVRVHPDIRKPEEPPMINIEVAMPISEVRLVHPITDPATGTTRDVIINQLVHRNILYDRVSGTKKWERVVPGLNVVIPWPKEEEPELKDHKGDTLRIEVEKKTFVPTLLRPPMPESIIDELRGKYSRFRTRHDPEWVAKIEAEERAKEDRKKLIEKMRTPLQEFHRAERANKKKKGKPRLTLEMLEKIGEVIAKNREITLNAPGVSAASYSQSPAQIEAPPPPAESTEETTSPPPST